MLKTRRDKFELQAVTNYNKAVAYMTTYFFKCENETYKVLHQAEKEVKAKKVKTKRANV